MRPCVGCFCVHIFPRQERWRSDRTFKSSNIGTSPSCSERKMGQEQRGEGKMKQRFCKGCGSETSDNRVFCTAECKSAYHEETKDLRADGHLPSKWEKSPRGMILKTCPVCDKGFSVPPSHKDQKHCSVRCHQTSEKRKGHLSIFPIRWKEYRGPRWKETRDEILERDGFKCVRCPSTQFLHVHHIIPFQNFLNWKEANVTSNLETLCSECHGKAEQAVKVRQLVFY